MGAPTAQVFQQSHVTVKQNLESESMDSPDIPGGDMEGRVFIRPGSRMCLPTYLRQANCH